MKLSTTTAIYRDRPSGKGKIPVIDCVKKLHEIGYRDVDINFNMMSKRDLELSRKDWESWGDELAEVLTSLGMTATQCHVLKEGYGNAGVCWDFGHANRMGYDQAQNNSGEKAPMDD